MFVVLVGHGHVTVLNPVVGCSSSIVVIPSGTISLCHLAVYQG